MAGYEIYNSTRQQQYLWDDEYFKYLLTLNDIFSSQLEELRLYIFARKYIFPQLRFIIYDQSL